MDSICVGGLLELSQSYDHADFSWLYDKIELIDKNDSDNNECSNNELSSNVFVEEIGHNDCDKKVKNIIKSSIYLYFLYKRI